MTFFVMTITGATQYPEPLTLRTTVTGTLKSMYAAGRFEEALAAAKSDWDKQHGQICHHAVVDFYWCEQMVSKESTQDFDEDEDEELEGWVGCD